MKIIRTPLLICICSFFGGVFSNNLLTSNPAKAATGQIKAFLDSNEINRLDLGVYNDSPIQDFYGEDGKPRLQFGTYSQAGEKGLPMAAFSDNKGHIKMILRLAGTNESPVIIFKDSHAKDRLVMGLSLNDASENPFITYTDESGSHNLISK